MKFGKVISQHLYEIQTIDGHNLDTLISSKDIDTIFFSENCFAIKNKIDNKFLTAFPNGEVKFFAQRCSHWEKFYILDKNILDFIQLAQERNYRDKYQLKIDNLIIKVKFDDGMEIIPSFIPMSKLNINNRYLEYTTVKQSIRLSNKNILIYFCIYGKQEYYDCFFLAIRSLIENGKYMGDILIKTDDIQKAHAFCKQFTNNIFYKNTNDSLGIFNRYYLVESEFYGYDTIIYFDSDILVTNNIYSFLDKVSSQGDFAAYQEGDLPLLEDCLKQNLDRKDFALKFKWFGINNLFTTDYIKDYYLYNSGCFIINNLERVKPIFDKIIMYRPFESYCGDQPFLNLALYNENNIRIHSLKRGEYLDFSRSEIQTQTCLNLNKTLIHFNSGVGNISKLALMQQAQKLLDEKPS